MRPAIPTCRRRSRRSASRGGRSASSRHGRIAPPATGPLPRCAPASSEPTSRTLSSTRSERRLELGERALPAPTGTPGPVLGVGTVGQGHVSLSGLLPKLDSGDGAVVKADVRHRLGLEHEELRLDELDDLVADRMVRTGLPAGHPQLEPAADAEVDHHRFARDLEARGPDHLATCSGSVQALNTTSRGASKTCVIVISCSAAASAGVGSVTASSFLDLPQMLVEPAD